MDKILVTGGSGFLGSHLVDRLVRKGHEVHVIDSRAGDPHLVENPMAKYYKLDIASAECVTAIRDIGPDIIFHLASTMNEPGGSISVAKEAEVNITGTIRVLDGARAAQTKKLIFTSSYAVYGIPAYLGMDENHPLRPVSAYGMTKRCAEEFIQLYGRLYNMNYTILRLSAIFGTRQDIHSDGSLIAGLIYKYMHRMPICLNCDGQQSEDFLYVDDALEALELCMEKGHGHILNIGSGHGTLMNELINLLNATFEIHVEPEYSTECSRTYRERYFDISQALRVLDWSPQLSLSDGILETVHYYRRTLRL